MHVCDREKERMKDDALRQAKKECQLRFDIKGDGSLIIFMFLLRNFFFHYIYRASHIKQNTQISPLFVEIKKSLFTRLIWHRGGYNLQGNTTNPDSPIGTQLCGFIE